MDEEPVLLIWVRLGAVRLAFVCSLLLVVSCASMVRPAGSPNDRAQKEFERIVPGMHESDLRSILGRPESVVKGGDLDCAGAQCVGPSANPSEIRKLVYSYSESSLGLCVFIGQDHNVICSVEFMTIDENEL